MRDWLKNLRDKHGMTQQSVADALKISKQYYQQIEAGKRQLKMSTELIIKFSDIFDLSPVSVLNMEYDFLLSSDSSRTV